MVLRTHDVTAPLGSDACEVIVQLREGADLTLIHEVLVFKLAFADRQPSQDCTVVVEVCIQSRMKLCNRFFLSRFKIVLLSFVAVHY